MDKAFWQAIKADQFRVPEGHNLSALTEALLPCLGSTDPELRDLLAYEILGTWVERGLYSPTQLRTMTDQLIANLRTGIGAEESDTTFLRTFSVLILAEIAAYDSQHRFFTEQELARVLEAALAYLEAEQDLRGYVAAQGWAHSVAHTADLLWVLARHPGLGREDLERILSAIGAKVTALTPYPYVAGEEERLGTAVRAALGRDLLDSAWLVGWVREIIGRHPWRQLGNRGELAVVHNTKAFLSALYIALEAPEDLRNELRVALKSLVPRFY